MTQDQAYTLQDYREWIQSNYVSRHPELFALSPDIFVPSFREAITQGTESALRRILKQDAPEVYSFEMLNRDFCDKLIRETDWFGKWCVQQGLPKNVPNTMNHYGAVLDDFGFYPCLQQLMVKYVSPLSRFLFPDVGGATLDGHHGFVVEYQIGKDESLSFHVDQSDVTLNVCLGEEFVGGNLYFGGIRCAVHQQTEPRKEEEISVPHFPGQALLHRGKHRHAAQQIEKGRRMNLILWCMSRSFQRKYDSSQCQDWCGFSE